MNKWVEVVSSFDRKEAIELFNKWKKNNPEWSHSLSDEDIRIDTIRTAEHKTLTRYRVRKKM